MNKFSPAFMSALLGMSIITHAYAEDAKTIDISPEIIERLYLDEAKFPGATLQCFQAGKEVLHEPGLRNVHINESDITALRLDGTTIRVLFGQNGESALCTVINRPDPENDG